MYVSKPECVVFSVVGEPFLDLQIRYHCPIFTLFNYHKPKQTTYTRRIWKYDEGNYGAFRAELDSTDWSQLSHEDINMYASNISDNILKLADTYILIKLTRIRPTHPPWFHNNLRKLIRKRKRAHRKAKSTNSPHHCLYIGNFEMMRLILLNMLRRFILRN